MSLISSLGLESPIIQAPMAGAHDAAMTIAVSSAGALGSLPCALLGAEQIVAEVDRIKSATDKPFNLNFFCHRPPLDADNGLRVWRDTLEPFYQTEGITEAPPDAPLRESFNEALCEVVESCKPQVVSFHFGLPQDILVQRIKAAGCLVFGSATTVDEARWLATNGCDAVIAQGVEAGGHRGIFLSDDPVRDAPLQPGLMALLQDILATVDLPVIAAGGIGDARAARAALTLGASMVQMGTAFLYTEEAKISALHRSALATAEAHDTALTNLFSGRPARSLVTALMRTLGPLNDKAAAFPLAGTALIPLKKKAESDGRSDYSSLWAGQGLAAARRTASEVAGTSNGIPAAADLTAFLADQINH